MKADITIKFNYSYLCERDPNYHRSDEHIFSVREKPYGLVREKILDSVEFECSEALKHIFASKEIVAEAAVVAELTEQAEKWLILFKKIHDLGLSVRSQNPLKNDNIVYIGDLVIKTEAELLKTPNFGRKSLNEIKEILSSYTLKFGMDIPEWPISNIMQIANDLYYYDNYEEMLLPAIKTFLKSQKSYTKI